MESTTISPAQRKYLTLSRVVARQYGCVIVNLSCILQFVINNCYTEEEGMMDVPTDMSNN
jgi:hypothetical protein